MLSEQQASGFGVPELTLAIAINKENGHSMPMPEEMWAALLNLLTVIYSLFASHPPPRFSFKLASF